MLFYPEIENPFRLRKIIFLKSINLFAVDINLNIFQSQSPCGDFIMIMHFFAFNSFNDRQCIAYLQVRKLGVVDIFSIHNFLHQPGHIEGIFKLGKVNDFEAAGEVEVLSCSFTKIVAVVLVVRQPVAISKLQAGVEHFSGFCIPDDGFVIIACSDNDSHQGRIGQPMQLPYAPQAIPA